MTPASQPLSFQTLLDLIEGRGDPGVGPSAGATVREIEELRIWWDAFRADARRLPLVSPPPLVSQRLRRLAAVRAGSAPPSRRVTATLETDSRRIGLPAGVRASASNLPSSRYQLTYRAPDVAVLVLDVAEADDVDGVIVRGQVLPERPTLPVFEVTARGPSGVMRCLTGDDLGGFELSGAPLDTSSLIATNDEIEIEIALRLFDAP